MTFEEYEIKQIEKELGEKEGRSIKVLSVRGKHITICSWDTYQLMKKKEGFIKEIE